MPFSLYPLPFPLLEAKEPGEGREEAMEFYEELFLTALISVLLAFLIGKLAVASAAADDAADHPQAAPPSADSVSAACRGVGLDPIEQMETEKHACASGAVAGESDRAEEEVIEVEAHVEASRLDLETKITEEKFSSGVDLPRVEESSAKKDNDEVEIARISDDLVKGGENFVKDEAERVVELVRVDAVEKEDVRAVREDKGGSLLHGEDEWEGIERSELEQLFGVATEFAGSEKGGDAVSKLSSEVQMQLYGLHKVATEGPCYETQPMALKVSARTKWHAWQRLGNMNPEASMEQYISLLTESIPGWMEQKSGEEAKGHDGNDPPVVEVSGTGQHDSMSSFHYNTEASSI